MMALNNITIKVFIINPDKFHGHSFSSFGDISLKTTYDSFMVALDEEDHQRFRAAISYDRGNT